MSPFLFTTAGLLSREAVLLESWRRENPKQETVETEGWLSWCTCSYLSQLTGPLGSPSPQFPWGQFSPCRYVAGHCWKTHTFTPLGMRQGPCRPWSSASAWLGSVCVDLSASFFPWVCSTQLPPLLDFVFVASLPVSLTLENHSASELECVLLASHSPFSDKQAETLRGDLAPCSLLPSAPKQLFLSVCEIEEDLWKENNSTDC